MDARRGILPATAIIAAILIAMVAMGCGDSGSEGSASTSASTNASSTPALSEAEFRKKANAACARVQATLKGRVSEFERQRAPGRPSPGSDMVHFVYLPTMAEQILELEKLGIPRGGGAEVNVLLDVERRAVESVSVVPRVPSIAVARRGFVKADELFRAYGLDSCATRNEPTA